MTKKIDMFHVDPGVQIQACVAKGVTVKELEDEANRYHPLGDMLWKLMDGEGNSRNCEDDSGNTHYMLTPDGKRPAKLTDREAVEKALARLAGGAPMQLDPGLTMQTPPEDAHIRAMFEMTLRKDTASFSPFEAETIALITAARMASTRLMWRHAGAAKALDPERFEKKPGDRMAAALGAAVMILHRQFGPKGMEEAKKHGLTEYDVQVVARIVSAVMMAEVFYAAFNLPELSQEEGEAQGAKFGRIGYVREETTGE